MKLKTDFVTNSSCASFVVSKENLTGIQVELIKNHISAVKIYNNGKFIDEYVSENDEWQIHETETDISGDTSMDNFDMLNFLLTIGVKEEDINYEGCY